MELDLPAGVLPWLATAALGVPIAAAAVMVAVHRRKPRRQARHGIVRDLPQASVTAAPVEPPVVDFAAEDDLAQEIGKEAGWWREETPWTGLPTVPEESPPSPQERELPRIEYRTWL